MSSPTSPAATTELQIWLNRAMEVLWLLAVFLVPLAFFDRDYAKSETIIAYVEIPKVALLRTLAALMGILWLIDWGLHGTLNFGTSFRLKNLPSLPAQWVAWLRDAMPGHPHRWLFVAVGFYLGTTLLSTVLSGSFQVSLWGEIPGQDGYPAYTVAAYILLFAVISTHLKTRPQLWRLLAVIVAMGVINTGYAVLQHYGHDFLNLTESTGGGTYRTTSFMGNAIFAAAVMLMTIPVTAMATVIALLYLPERKRAARNKLAQWLPSLAVLAAGALALAVQFLGLVFTLSRGPWLGTTIAIALMVGLVSIFTGWANTAKLAVIIGLGGVIAVGVLINPSFKSDLDPGPVISSSAVSDSTLAASLIDNSVQQPEADVETPSNISVVVEPTASEAFQRMRSMLGIVAGGLTGGRQTHWKVSWVLIRDRPWFEFDNLSLRWLRPLVGYGPDLFRYTYLLESPPEGSNHFPLEPDHAHNYFIHQTVEQGFLGTLSSLGVFAAVFLIAAYQLFRSNSAMNPLHKLMLVTLISVLAGRGLEMMVGVARISDLTVYWVLLGMFSALPLATQELTPQPIRSTPRGRSPSLTHTPSLPRAEFGDRLWLCRLALVTWLIGALLVLTWMKGISYPRASVLVGDALEYSRQGDLPSTLAAIDKAIELAPDVPVYYNWRASVYNAYRQNPQVPRFERCSLQNKVSYEVCLAALAHESNLAGSNQRPFYYRSRIKLADSAFKLLRDDEAIRHYQESLDLVPSSWALRDNLASAFIQQGKPEQALRLLAESLEITKDTGPSINSLVLRASAYLDLDRPGDSIDDLNRALQISPRNVRVHASLAVVYTSVGQDLKAREHGDKAVQFGGNRAALDRAMEAMRQRKNRNP